MCTQSPLPILAACTLVAACLEPRAEGSEPALATDLAAYALAAGVEYAATKYDVDFDLDSHDLTMTAHLDVQTDGACLTIPMRARSTDIKLDDQPATNTSAKPDTELTVCKSMGSSFKAGVGAKIAVTSKQTPERRGEGDVGFTVKRLGSATYSYLLSWIEGCDLFGPCDTRPDRFAKYNFKVRHASDTQVLCPGVIVETPAPMPQTEPPTKHLTECNFEYAGGPTYSTFGLIARAPKWQASSLGEWSNVRVSLFSDTDSLRTAFANAELDGSISWFESMLGQAFPYGDELRFIEAPTIWGGFEHPGTIVLQRGLTDSASREYYPESLEHVVLHELAHQWAGNRTTLRSSNDFAWKEAAAEYLTYLYEVDRENYADAADLAAYWKARGLAAGSFPVPADAAPLKDFYGAAYGAGTMTIFRQIEAMYGQAAVRSALEKLLGTSDPPFLGIDDVREALQRETGAELQQYFNEWVRGKGRPTSFTVQPTRLQLADGSWEVHLEETQAPEEEETVARGCAFRVRLVGDGDNYADFAFNNGPDGGPFATPPAQHLSFEPRDHIVDPYSECLVQETGAPFERRDPSDWMIF